MKISILTRSARRATFFVFALIMVWSGVSHAQPKGKWHAGPPLPSLNQTGRTLFVDSLLGYYIGQDEGFVTKDGGLTWTMMNFPDNARPYPTYLFAPEHNTIISFQSFHVDSNGVKYSGIIKSTDQGTTWLQIQANQIPAIIPVFTMWTTYDGFRIWLDDATQKILTVAATHDGGITWTDIRGDATLAKYTAKLKGPGANALSSAWGDTLHGVISVSLAASVDSSSTAILPVLTTTDGGRTWTETYPTYNGSRIYQHSNASVYGAKTIWSVPSFAKYAEYFFYSTNFGTTWQNSNRFKNGALGGVGMPGIVKFEPVSATAAWAIAVSDSEHPIISRNLIAYNEIPNSWTLSTSFPKGFQDGHQYYWDISGIQFTDPDHGYIPLQKYVDTSTGASQPAVPVDTVVIYRYYINPPSAVSPESKIPPLLCTPNPASSTIKISGFTSNEQVREIRIANTLGKESSYVPKISGSEIELDLSNLPSGSYYVNVKTSLRQESIPVMVVR